MKNLYPENEIVKLRALEFSDINLLFQWENDGTLWELSNTLTPFSKHVLEKYIENSHLSIYETNQFRFMIESKKEAKTIGAIDLFDFEPHHSKAGIGILIHNQEDRKKKYATNALEILIKYCFEVLNLHQLYCNIEIDNIASIHLLTKVGFEIIGTKKDWIRSGKIFKNVHFLQLINV